jgi:hypothetical protein
MPRNYSDKFLYELSQANPDRLGVRLGRLCVEMNIPASYVAVALKTSRMTIYSWFRGRGVSENKRALVETFIRLVEDDAKVGMLPAKNMVDAKNYIQEMLGVSI